MYTNNPYAQAGWHNPANPNAISNQQWGVEAHPPTFGLLPSVPSAPSILTFRFISCNPNILSCLVNGPKGYPYFSVSSTPDFSSSTIYRSGGPAIATIFWRSPPTIESQLVLRQNVAQWLPLDGQQNYRTMTISGRVYGWYPRGAYLCLCSAGPAPPELYARVSRSGNEVVLEVAPEAIQLGLLEFIIIATVVLQSGRVIDN
ncbi:hypothetical protein BDQ17DRAFT_1256810 [Cyathus striatus]|nr:hypothetical protein BDQ17DRAFT_1256810 [Cyathus striatus]